MSNTIKQQAIVYVSPFIDRKQDIYLIDYVEMVNGTLTIKSCEYQSLLAADDAIRALKKQVKQI